MNADKLKLHLPLSLMADWYLCCLTFANIPWWRHQMETFSALLALCAGNSPVLGEFPAQRPVTRSFDVIFDLRPNKRLSIQSWGWWFETLSCSLWRHCNAWLSHWLGGVHRHFKSMGARCEIAARWMPKNLTGEKSTLVQVMAWCRQATCHYLSQCWPSFMASYGVTSLQ